MKHTRVVSTKCTPGFACRAFSDTTLVCFIVNEHTTKCSRYSTAAVHSVAARRRLCQIKNAHATAWWREADAGWLLACRCRSGAGNTGSAGLNATGGVTTGCQRRSASIAGTLGCVFIDNETHESGVTKCTTGEAWSVFSGHHSSVFHSQLTH